ncbi:MAG: hypothetical protein M3273_07760, partial [Actinomycetota bacterium]|nr:hypothetical protein [Actinomycetota bacterium]
QIARDKQNAPGQMNGTGRLAVFSPQGNEIYTLYTQQGSNYTHVKPEQARRGKVYAFVHQLNLDGAWTHCIDLPAPFGTGTATSHAMAISQDGSRLYVADPSSGGLAVIDPRNSRVLESVIAEIRPLRRGASATVSPDGTLYLAGPDRVLAYDGESLDPLRSMQVDGITTGIATNAEGSELYAGTKDGVLVLDAETGDVLRTISLPGARGLVTGA